MFLEIASSDRKKYLKKHRILDTVHTNNYCLAFSAHGLFASSTKMRWAILIAICVDRAGHPASHCSNCRNVLGCWLCTLLKLLGQFQKKIQARNSWAGLLFVQNPGIQCFQLQDVVKNGQIFDIRTSSNIGGTLHPACRLWTWCCCRTKQTGFFLPSASPRQTTMLWRQNTDGLLPLGLIHCQVHRVALEEYRFVQFQRLRRW